MRPYRLRSGRTWYRSGRPAISVFRESQPAHARLKRSMAGKERRYFWDRPMTELAARCVVNNGKYMHERTRKRPRSAAGTFLGRVA